MSEQSQTFYEVDFERRIATLELTAEECAELRKHRHLNGVVLFRDVKIEPEHQLHVRLHIETLNHVIDTVSREMMEAGKEPLSRADIFKQHYFEPVRHTIWRACKKVFTDKLYSPVDTRSTFSANRKARFGIAATAEEMGHAGVTTTRDFYAPASKAWARYANKPTNTQTIVPAAVQAPSASALSQPST